MERPKTLKLIIDTHLDLAWNALGWGRDLTQPLAEINRSEQGMTDDDARGHATTSLPEMRCGGVAVCLATILARCNPDVRPVTGPQRMSLDYTIPAAAYAAGQGQLAYYSLLAQGGQVTILRTARDLTAHWMQWEQHPSPELPVGIILAMEGADPILAPEQAARWFDDGLRSVGLAHYGRSRYAAGSGATGPLTPAGVRLLAELERLGMILDVTHLSEPGFSESLDRFGGPVMASHNNCQALVPGERQFSDRQLQQLFARGAVIGVAMDAWMLYPNWQIGRTSRAVVGMEAVADQIDHICQTAGNCRHVGIGSDLDGGYGTEQTPHGLNTIAGLQQLAGILAARGYAEADIDACFHGNNLQFFGKHLP